MMKKFVYSSVGTGAKNRQFSTGQPPAQIRDLEINNLPGDHEAPDLRSPRKRYSDSTTTDENQAKKRRSKITAHFDDEVDDLDILGSAALEQYELTQNEGQSPHYASVPTPCSPVPNFSLVPVSTPKDSLPKSHSTNIFDDRGGAMKPPKSHHPPPKSHDPTAPQSHDLPSPSLAIKHKSHDPPCLPGEGVEHTGLNGQEERIKQLQEQNYSKDGEVKVLRGEKERLLRMVGEKEREMHTMQALLLSEKQAEKKLITKERDSLFTKLQFKEQELVAMAEKCAKLEQKRQLGSARKVPSSTSPSPSFTSSHSSTPVPTKSRPRPAATQQDKPTEFLSTESFMPLSQLNTEDGSITPVHIGTASRIQTSLSGGEIQRSSGAREKGKGGGERGEGGRGSGQGVKEEKKSQKNDKSKKQSRSRSISPNPSDLKKMRRRSKSDRDSSSTCTEDKRGGGGGGDLGEKIPQEVEKPPPRLHVPGRKLDGAQILLLLVKQNLQKPPPLLSHPGDQQVPPNSTTINSSGDSTDGQISVDSQILGGGGGRKKITGLLSLLRLDSNPLSFAKHSTPAPTRNSDAASSSSSIFPQLSSSSSCMSSSSLEVLTPPCKRTTPSRPSRLSLSKSKPHALARTNLVQSRTRHNSGLLSAPTTRSLSAANTPQRSGGFLTEHTTSTLFSSFSTRDLHDNIANLLASSELSRFVPWRREMLLVPPYSSITNNKGIDNGYTSVIRILNQVSDLVTRYCSDQMSKISLESSDNTNSDTSSLMSPKSSSSTSSKFSSSDSLLSPLIGDQKLVTQALETLHILATYSREVREQTLLQPPEFAIDNLSVDSRQNPSSLNSSLEGGSGEGERTAWGDSGRKTMTATSNMSSLVGVSHRLTEMLKTDDDRGGGAQNDLSDSIESEMCTIANGKDLKLTQVKDPSLSLSGKVWTGVLYRQEADSSSSFVTGNMVPPSKGRGCGHLFPVLLDLPVPLWQESNENTLICFKVLVSLAEDCSLNSLYRFGQLLYKDTIAICIEKEDPLLTSTVLSLFTLLVRSEDVVKMLCGHGDPDPCGHGDLDPCALLTCYQCLLDPPSSPSSPSPSEGKDDASCKIQIQIIRLISRISTTANGSLALFEKCNCSNELLKCLVSLLDKMVDNVYQINQWSQIQLTLVCSVIVLVYRISIIDDYFDSHRDLCEDTYSFVFNRLAVLLKSSRRSFQELSMVSELLTYCEDVEESMITTATSKQ